MLCWPFLPCRRSPQRRSTPASSRSTRPLSRNRPPIPIRSAKAARSRATGTTSCPKACARGRSPSTSTAARALYGKLFLPKGFTTTGKLPAVVVGHGINALSIGIEKFAARFAERGLVAMAIDYQSYGFSGSGSDDIRLLEPDTTTDARAVTEKEARILLKRTNLNNVHEVADFRAAVSFLQGEPGVDPDSHRHLGIEQRRIGRDRGRRRRCARQGGRVAGRGAAAGAARAGADGRELPEGRDSSACAKDRAPKSTAASRSAARSISGRTSAIATCGPGRRSIRSGRRRRCCSCRRRRMN